MIKTFLFGILLGLGLAFGALYAFPVVDQVRENSIISVATNGGNTEAFHINVPMDRIMVGASDMTNNLPAELNWPDAEQLQNIAVELYKVRNTRDAVIGIAARSVVSADDASSVEWLLHFPARGSMFINMNSGVDDDGFRRGELRSGSRELELLVGTFSERWVGDTQVATETPDDAAGQLGRIELQANYIAPLDETIE